MIAGALLVLSSLAFVIITASLEKTAEKRIEEITSRMLSLMPEIRNAQSDDRVDVSMASLSIDGTDYCALLEIPRYGAALPVCTEWNKTSVRMTPCRYTGSIYDGSIIIGGSDARGQLDFVSDITEGDAVLLTDAQGYCYAYKVSSVETSDSASNEVLSASDADLVLFAHSTYRGGYTIIKCTD